MTRSFVKFIICAYEAVVKKCCFWILIECALDAISAYELNGLGRMIRLQGMRPKHGIASICVGRSQDTAHNPRFRNRHHDDARFASEENLKTVFDFIHRAIESAK